MRAAEPQRIFNPGLIALAYGSNKNALSEEEISKIKSTATPWPPNAQPKGTYIVSAGYSSFIFDYVYLPAGFRLSLDHDVQGINWQVRLLEFGVGASFDISAAPPPPFHMQTDVSNPFPPPHTWPEPPAQPDMPGQPYYHRPGAPGLPGLDGHPGNAGRPLYWLVTSQVMKGSLWIITNGGSGGPGGKGGKGQLGGGDRCDGVGYSDGGDGGRGGRGGDGGKGGPTSTVQIQINSLPTGFILRPDATAGYCGSASSPAPWTEGADDGRIVVWGAPWLRRVQRARGDPWWS